MKYKSITFKLYISSKYHYSILKSYYTPTFPSENFQILLFTFTSLFLKNCFLHIGDRDPIFVLLTWMPLVLVPISKLPSLWNLLLGALLHWSGSISCHVKLSRVLGWIKADLHFRCEVCSNLAFSH